MNDELKKIKKIYGEGMAKLCRDLFPTLVEKGLLFDILKSNFQENRSLSEDIIKNGLEREFRDFVNSYTEEEYIEKAPIDKTPFELMKMAGYDLFECKTEEDIQRFKHYYAKDEELCTFKGGRLKKNHVFFAVKQDVKDINRADFSKPMRQDKYGTSVVGIQFSRGKNNYVSILNRYNHTVPDCNATFSNNLDNIIEGLTESFGKEYGLEIVNQKGFFHIPRYIREIDGKFYKFNSEINNKYYCSNNIIIDNRRVVEYDKNKYLLVDYFLIDLENKNISLYDKNIEEDFVNHVKDIDKIEIKKLKTAETKSDKEITIKIKDGSEIAITTNKNNQIISLVADDITEIGDDFLHYSNYISKTSLSSVKNIGNRCLYFSPILDEINTPLLERVGNDFLHFNQSLVNLNLPSVKEIGEGCLFFNETLKELEAPLLEKFGAGFAIFNKGLVKLNLPSIEDMGKHTLQDHPVYSKMSVKRIREQSKKYKAKEDGAYIEQMPVKNSLWSRFKQESLNFINEFRRQRIIDELEQTTPTSVQDENSDELNNSIKESLEFKNQLRVIEKYEDKERDENTVEQIDTQKSKESEEDDRSR